MVNDIHKISFRSKSYKKSKKASCNRAKNRENMLFKIGDIKKDRVHEFPKYKTIRSFGLAVSNGTTTSETAADYHMYISLKNLRDKDFQKKR